MHYLSMYGKEELQSFKSILEGKIAYTPEKISEIDPDIIRERDFSLRLNEILAPYTNDHPQLKNITPIISSNIGMLYTSLPNYSVWRPLNHLSLLGELLLASMVEAILPESLSDTHYFIADHEDTGLSFAQAFLLEKKKLFISSEFLHTAILPKVDPLTEIYQFSAQDRQKIKRNVKNHSKICVDRSNFIRILGHMATIIHALFETEIKRIRFYNDPVSLVLPADNIEFILAAFYLSKSKLPIKSIYAISSYHRMAHNFFNKGEFKITDAALFDSLEISMDRLLFEASRGSLEKLNHWKKSLRETGNFKVDVKTFHNIQSVIKPIFSSPSFNDEHKKFEEKTSLTPTNLSLVGYQIAEKNEEHILTFDIQNPDLTKYEQDIPFLNNI